MNRDTLLYFAYGSNLSLARLRQRTPSARRHGTWLLPGHSLRFHKAGRDGSGKCDAFYTGDHRDQVIGALFRIDIACKRTLDDVEGLGRGYGEKTVALHHEDGRIIEALTYYATAIDPALQPYHWYLDHVLRGARESGLPSDYIQAIQSVTAIPDTNRERDRRERAVHLDALGDVDR